MAAVLVASAGVAEYLPLLVLGGLGAYVATRPNAQAPPAMERSKEEKTMHQHLSEMEVNGAVASHWHNMQQKAGLMNATMGKKGLALDLTDAGYDPNPNRNPLEEMYLEHAELSEFDRRDTFFSLQAEQPEIRMRKRVPIVTTLTEEIYHPSRPDRGSAFQAGKHLPNYANDVQIAEAVKLLDRDMTSNQSLRKDYGVAFFNRAPGQSFRYE